MSSWVEETNKILREKYARGGIVSGTEDDYYETVSMQLNTAFEKDVWDVVIGIYHLLIDKNRKYGDSALNPARIFSKANAEEQLLVRIDDKLNRIKNQQNDEDEDVVQDLIGYLILLTIARERNA